MRPTISIIMPVYNVERYINASIDSVLNQTYIRFELILVDDGSPDNCPEICDEYAKKDTRIKVIHKKNGGLSSARNIGIIAAKGEYIQFLDSDDMLEANALEQLVSIVEENNVDVVIFGVNIHTDNTKNIIKSGPTQTVCFHNIDEVRQNFSWLTKNNMWNYAWDKLYRKQLITKSDLKFNSHYDRVCEDTVFLLDVFLDVKSIYIYDKYLHNYYIRETQSVVRKFIPERFEKYYGRFIKTKEVINSLQQNNENINLLYSHYFQYNLWAYELLFHKDCKYTGKMRFYYIRNTFSIDREANEFRKNTIRYYKNNKNKFNISEMSSMAVQTIIRRWYYLAWFLHMASLLKNKLFKKVKVNL